MAKNNKRNDGSNIIEKTIVTDVRTDHRLPLARETSIARRLQNSIDRQNKETKRPTSHKRDRNDNDE